MKEVDCGECNCELQPSQGSLSIDVAEQDKDVQQPNSDCSCAPGQWQCSLGMSCSSTSASISRFLFLLAFCRSLLRLVMRLTSTSSSLPSALHKQQSAWRCIDRVLVARQLFPQPQMQSHLSESLSSDARRRGRLIFHRLSPVCSSPLSCCAPMTADRTSSLHLAAAGW